MPATLTKIELKGAKIVETPASTGVAVAANGLDNLVAALANAKEIDNGVLNLAPGDSDIVVALGNIAGASVVILIPDGRITVKLDGSVTPLQVDIALIVFGTSITGGITASNPSVTEVRSVRKYIATATD